MEHMDKAVKQYLSRIASKGGKARAEKYDRDTLSKWGKKAADRQRKRRNRNEERYEGQRCF